MEKGKGCVSDEVERPSSGKLCLAQGRPGIYLVFILDWMRLSHTKEGCLSYLKSTGLRVNLSANILTGTSSITADQMAGLRRGLAQN